MTRTTAYSSETDCDRELVTDSLFAQLQECRGEAEREHLRSRVIAANMPVAQALARRYHGHGENHDDLAQVAYLGLTKAVQGFEPGRGRHFLAYAVPTITGELKRHFRDKCWTVRPPRRIQDLQRDISSARQRLHQDLCRQPTTGEIAEVLDVPVAEVVDAVAAQGCFTPNSLDLPLGDGSSTSLGDLLPAEDHEQQRAEARMLLHPLIRKLPEEDQQILVLRFFEEWTQQQIAEKFGTSQMQISRRLTRLMNQLRSMLAEPGMRAA